MRPGMQVFMKKKIGFLCNIILFLTAAIYMSCSYKFSGSGQLPMGADSVFVAVFENQTAETGVENYFTNDLIFEFTRNGMDVVKKEVADTILSGSIDNIDTETVSYQGLIISKERRIKVSVTMKLADKNGNIIWSSGNLTQDETYGVFDEKVATNANKRLAIKNISKRMAEEAYDRMTESF